MRKKIMAAMCAFTAIVSQIPAECAEEISVYVNGEKVFFDVMPELRNDRTFVPIRAVSDMLGLNVGYDDETRRVFLGAGDTEIELTIDSSDAIVSGRSRKLDAAPYETGGRTLVPLRFISEAMDCDVKWEDETSSVYITKKAQDKDAAGAESTAAEADEGGYDIAEILYADTDMYAITDRYIYFVSRADGTSKAYLKKYNIYTGETKILSDLALRAEVNGANISGFTPNAVEIDDKTGKVWMSGTFSSGASADLVAVYDTDNMAGAPLIISGAGGMRLRAASGDRLLIGTSVVNAATGAEEKRIGKSNANIIFGMDGEFYGVDSGAFGMSVYPLDDTGKKISSKNAVTAYFAGNGKFYYRAGNGDIYMTEPQSGDAVFEISGLPKAESETGYNRFAGVGDKMRICKDGTIIYDSSLKVFCFTGAQTECEALYKASVSDKPYIITEEAKCSPAKDHTLYKNLFYYINMNDKNVYRIDLAGKKEELFFDIGSIAIEDDAVYSEYEAKSIFADPESGRIFVSGTFLKKDKTATIKYALLELKDNAALVSYIKNGDKALDIVLMTPEKELLIGGMLYNTDTGKSDIGVQRQAPFALGMAAGKYVRVGEEEAANSSGYYSVHKKIRMRSTVEVLEKRWITRFRQNGKPRACCTDGDNLYIISGYADTGYEFIGLDISEKPKTEVDMYKKMTDVMSVSRDKCAYPKSLNFENADKKMYACDDGSFIIYDNMFNRVLRFAKNE